jgi:hypothetical protein
MTLMQVRVGLLQGGIPPTAVVQVVPNGEWLPAWQVVGDCVDFKPTRAGGAMALLFVVPLVLLIVHRAIFAGAGGLWTIALLVAGIAGQAFIGMTPRLRTQSTGELLSKRAFQLVVGGTLLVCLVPGTRDRDDRVRHLMGPPGFQTGAAVDEEDHGRSRVYDAS